MCLWLCMTVSELSLLPYRGRRVDRVLHAADNTLGTVETAVSTYSAAEVRGGVSRCDWRVEAMAVAWLWSLEVCMTVSALPPEPSGGRRVDRMLHAADRPLSTAETACLIRRCACVAACSIVVRKRRLTWRQNTCCH